MKPHFLQLPSWCGPVTPWTTQFCGMLSSVIWILVLWADLGAEAAQIVPCALPDQQAPSFQT